MRKKMKLLALLISLLMVFAFAGDSTITTFDALKVKPVSYTHLTLPTKRIV